MRSVSLTPLCEWAVLLLVAFSILWKGGKSLEATWILAVVAGVVTLVSWWERRKRMTNGQLPVANEMQIDDRSIHPLLWWSLIVFIAWSVLSYIFSSTKNYGFDEILRDVSLVLLFLWIVRQKTHWQLAIGKWQFLDVLVWSTLAACLIGIIVYSLQPVNRFVGTFFDYRFDTDYWPNAFAEYILLAWPLAMLWLVMRRTRVGWFVGLLVNGFVIGCLLLSYSRGAWIAFSGQVILLGIFSVLSLKKEGEGLVIRAKRIVGPIIVVAIFALLTFFAVNILRAQFHPVQSVTEKITFTASEGSSSFTERRDFWKQALTLSLKHPLLGWGPYSFRFVQPRLQTSVLSTSDHPHNVFLKLAMERGWPAAIFLGFIVVYILYGAAKPFIRLFVYSFIRKKSEPINLPTIFIIIGVTGVLAHNFIDYNLQFVSIALPFWLLLGMLADEASSVPSVPSVSSVSLHHFQKSVEILIACFLLIVTISEGRFLFLSSLGRHAQERGEDLAALHWFDLSRHQLFSRDLLLSRTLLLIKENAVPESRRALDDYFFMNREDPRPWRLLGDLELQEKHPAAARKAYEEALAREKWNDLSLLRGYLETVEQIGDRIVLDAKFQEINALIDAFAAALVQNVHYIDLSHTPEEFINVSHLMAQFYPEKAPHYQVVAARVDRHVKEERAKLRGRGEGYLW